MVPIQLGCKGEGMPTIVHCVFGLGCGGAERLLLTTVEGLYKRGYVNQHVLVADLSTPAMRHYVEAISQYATVYEAPFQADLKENKNLNYKIDSAQIYKRHL